jgi:3-dehydroquinate dehydratase-1
MARTLWKKPLIYVGCVSTEQGLALITRKQSAADLIELRFDTLYAGNRDAVELAVGALQKRKNPVLLTIRTKEEGGAKGWKSTERVRLFRRLLPHVDAVDLEFANLRLIKEVLLLARGLDKKIILSAHSVTRKITYKRGAGWLDNMRRVHADIYKIATLTRSLQDLRVLVRLQIDHPELRLAIMGLGPMAGLSRRVLPLLGSRLVYGYLDVPAAKNQPALKELREQR